jgi:outer membrane protein TolC
MQITRTSYQASKATVLDLIDSERTLLNFEKSYWKAVTEYARSLAELDVLVGRGIQ